MARRARPAAPMPLLLLLCCVIAVAAATTGAAGSGGARAGESADDVGVPSAGTAPPPRPPPPVVLKTIHLVPHSHDDGGWLKTFDQYLYGARQDIQEASVGTILDSVLAQLRLPAGAAAAAAASSSSSGALARHHPKHPNNNATTATTTATTTPQPPQTQEQRTFACAEVGFFRAWWRSLPKRQRRRAIRLVRLGLLEFAGGGTVQHDEATPHWRDMLDQTTRGHRWLARVFGPAAVPVVSWQLDPFGHSAAHAELFGSPSGGHHAFIYGRSDWRDRERRAARGELEHVWRPSASFAKNSSDVLALAYLSGNYGPPPGLDWNWGTSPNGPIVDDPKSPDYNAEVFLKRFDEAAEASFAAAPKGSKHALWMMGSDFTYSTAAHYYRNMDRLVRLVNKREAGGGVAYRAVYSTPGRYLAARAAEAAEGAAAGGDGDDGSDEDPSPPPLSLRRDDLFPYSDDPHSFWTGYFTSRPESKALIRAAGARLQAARQLAALSRLAAVARADPSSFSSSSSSPLSWLPPWERSPLPGGCERLEAAVALAQHHDAVTGTAKQAVVRDYHRRLYEGLGDADALIGEALRRLMRTTIAPAALDGEGRRPSSSSSPAVNRTVDPPGPSPPEPRPYPRIPDLLSCPLLNVSHCTHSAGAGASRGFLLVAYNPLSRPRVAAPLRVPVSVSAADDSGSTKSSSSSSSNAPMTFQVWELVTGIGGGWKRPLVSQLLPRSDATARLQASTHAAVAEGRAERRAELKAGFGTHDLAFVAEEIPAFGYSTFLVQRVPAVAKEGAGGSGGNNSGKNGPIPATVSSEQRFGRGGEPVPPGTWPKPVVVGNYDPDADDDQGVRLSFDYISGRLSSVVGGGGFAPQRRRGGDDEGESGESGGGGWGPLPATMALASYLPHVGKVALGLAANSSSPSACPLGPRDPRAAARAALTAALAAANATSSNVAGAEQSSGAYIFRPDQSRPRAFDAALEEEAKEEGASLPPIPAAALQGPVVSEVRQEFAPNGRWASLTLRVWPLPPKKPAVPRPRTAGSPSAAAGAVVEVEWTVGPLLPPSPSSSSAADGGAASAASTSPPPGPPPPPGGREAIFRLSTALLSEGVFFTDGNGREMQQRRRNRRPWRWPADFYFEPQAANYHPITTGAALGDGELTTSVATDRAQGAASLADGELEVMVHRATPADDARGVGEPLRETAGACRQNPPRDPDGSVPADACGKESSDGKGAETSADGGGGLIARGTFRVRFSRARDAARLSRLDQEELLSPLVLAFAPLSTERDVAEVGRAFGGAGEEEGSSGASAPAVAAAVPRWGLGAAAPDGGIGGGDPDTPIRVVTLMRSDELHGARDAEELCEEEEEDEGEGDDDGSLTPPLRCGPEAEAAAAALPYRYIVRLAHVFAAGEHPDGKMSKPATFDLNVLFARAGFGLSADAPSANGHGANGGNGGGNGAKNDIPRIKRVTELSLTASVPRADLPPRPQWRVAEDHGDDGRGGGETGGPAASWPGAWWRGPRGGGGGGGRQPPFPTYDPRDHGAGEDAERASRGIVELYPMEVRTFEVELVGGGGNDEAAGRGGETGGATAVV